MIIFSYAILSISLILRALKNLFSYCYDDIREMVENNIYSEFIFDLFINMTSYLASYFGLFYGFIRNKKE
jgi:hypothetical protein